MKLNSRLLVAVALLASSCAADGSLTPQAQTLVSTACKIDAATQPVIVPLTPTPVQVGDNLLVHPLVVSACAQIGGTPVAATTASATTVAAPVATTAAKP